MGQDTPLSEITKAHGGTSGTYDPGPLGYDVLVFWLSRQTI